MLLTKQQRRKQVCPVLSGTKYQLQRQALIYRLERYSRLIKLGVSEHIANRVLKIWEKGCKTIRDEKLLDQIADLLEKGLQPTKIKQRKIALAS